MQGPTWTRDDWADYLGIDSDTMTSSEIDHEIEDYISSGY